MDDGARNRPGLAIGNTPDSGEAGLSVDQRDQTGCSLADDGVAFPVTKAPTCLDARRTLSDTATSEALALLGRSAAVTSPPLAPPQMLPQRAAFPAVVADVLVDALATDYHLTMAGDLLGAPLSATLC